MVSTSEIPFQWLRFAAAVPQGGVSAQVSAKYRASVGLGSAGQRQGTGILTFFRPALFCLFKRAIRVSALAWAYGAKEDMGNVPLAVGWLVD